jgi:hypothetical protein
LVSTLSRADGLSALPRPRRPLTLVLRPFGYALVGVVWTALSAIILALGPGALAGAVYLSFVPTPWGGVTWSGFVEGRGVWEILGLVFLALPMVALVWGGAVLWALPCASVPLALLSFTFVARALRPGLAGDALSFTTYAARGSTLGPYTVSNVALSLQPVHRSRWTDLLMRFYAAGWQPSGRDTVVMLPAGFGWWFLMFSTGVDVWVWLRWVFLVAGVALSLWSVWLLRRSWVARFERMERARASSRPVTALSKQERAERLAAVRERRAKRLAAVRAQRGKRRSTFR